MRLLDRLATAAPRKRSTSKVVINVSRKNRAGWDALGLVEGRVAGQRPSNWMRPKPPESSQAAAGKRGSSGAESRSDGPGLTGAAMARSASGQVVGDRVFHRKRLCRPARRHDGLGMKTAGVAMTTRFDAIGQ